MQVLDHVHLVGGGGLGFSNVTDGHIYLIDGGGELALIDSGSGLDNERILQNIREAGFDPAKLSVVLLTHSHWDHARGARGLSELTGADIGIHHGGAKVLTEELWRNHLVTRTGIPLESPKDPERKLKGGDVVQVGEISITVLETLGHTNDSVCYLVEDSGRKVAFTGDTLVGEGAIGATWYDSDFIAYRDGLQRLRAWEPEAIMPGHRLFSVRNGSMYVQKALDLFDSTWQDHSTVGHAFYPSWWLNAIGPDVANR